MVKHLLHDNFLCLIKLFSRIKSSRMSTTTVTEAPSEQTTDLQGLLRGPRIAPPSVARLLDGMTHPERVAAIRSLGRAQQRALWDAVDGFRPVGLSDIVPTATPAEQQVRHFGKNSLPMFTHFEKRFLRPKAEDAAAPKELHGYNFQSSAIGSWFGGPGYFVAVPHATRPEVLIDYRRLPETHPESWPEIRSNERGGARLVYGFMVDTLRRVSEHVTIGRANRHGKDMDAWFLLCRDENR
jgi:hypothetical protein